MGICGNLWELRGNFVGHMGTSWELGRSHENFVGIWRIHGNLWELRGPMETLWELGGSHGILWELMETCGTLFELVRTSWVPWELVETYGNLWEFMQTCGNFVGPIGLVGTVKISAFARNSDSVLF